jgi:primosomal protein N' (replication factor Y)
LTRRIFTIALDTPLDTTFDYSWTPADDLQDVPAVGQLALVPFGRREVVGLIIEVKQDTDVEVHRLREVIAIRSQLSPLTRDWLDLCGFAADYYQRPLGEVALPCLPKSLRGAKTLPLDRALKKLASPTTAAKPTDPSIATPRPSLNDEQQSAVQAIASSDSFQTHLLFGVTGSGKTEVYLHAAERILERESANGRTAQILILVPEINLTPQLEASVRARFPALSVVTLHSQLAEGERLRSWLRAHQGEAAIVLGTRLAILASMPKIQLIIVDEEHDPSYKQQEGLRYSARDLAIWRARQNNIPIVLGSATPSIESWQHAQTGRYRLLRLTQRAAANAQLPHVGLIDMEIHKAPDGLSAPLVAALRARLERGEQSLLFLNRRSPAR